MCNTFIWYYNKIENHSICRSELVSPAYTEKYLAGTRNVTWDPPSLEYVATVPRHLAGMTLSEISDSRYVNWSPEQRAQLQRDHILHPQVDICANEEQTFVTYPLEAIAYRPPQQCSLIR